MGRQEKDPPVSQGREKMKLKICAVVMAMAVVSVFAGNNWNFGIIPRERSQGVSCAAQIEFALKNWTVSGTVIMVR